MTDDEIKEMIEEADRDGDGEISEKEFMRIMKRQTSSEPEMAPFFKSVEIKKMRQSREDP